MREEQRDGDRDRDRDDHGDDRGDDRAEGEHRDAEDRLLKAGVPLEGGQEVAVVLADREGRAVGEEGRDGSHDHQKQDAGAPGQAEEDPVTGTGGAAGRALLLGRGGLPGGWGWGR